MAFQIGQCNTALVLRRYGGKFSSLEKKVEMIHVIQEDISSLGDAQALERQKPPSYWAAPSIAPNDTSEHPQLEWQLRITVLSFRLYKDNRSF